MSLPEPWVDRIFTKLNLVYGHQFLSRWDGLAIAEVKADWGHELRGFAQNPGAITYGLEHLPLSKPPTVLEFRALCNNGPAAQQERHIAIGYDRVPADPERVRQALARLREMQHHRPDRDGGSWAYELAEKDRQFPESVTPTVRRMYRESIVWQEKHQGKPGLASLGLAA